MNRKTFTLASLSLAIGLAQNVQLSVSHTGGTSISGNVKTSPQNYVIQIDQTHKDGHSDQATAVPAANGDFKIDLPQDDKLNAGDVVKVTAVPKPGTVEASVTGRMLPTVSQILATNPPVILFASSTKLTVGSTIKIAIASTDSHAPADLTRTLSASVIADDAIQLTKKLKSISSLPKPSTLTVMLMPASHAKNDSALPAIAQIMESNPPIIRFAASIKQSTGSKITITFHADDKCWPTNLLADQTVTVIGSDTVLLTNGIKFPSQPCDPSTLTATLKPADPQKTAVPTIEDPFCEWGAVRCYAYFGAVFSEQNNDLSKTDPYFDFALEWSWLKADRLLLTGFFDTRLTQMPTSTTTAQTGTTTASSKRARTSAASASTAATSGSDTFATSSKSAEASGGLYFAPYATTLWKFNGQDFGLFPAALFKGGVQGKLDGTIDPNNLSFPNQDKSAFSFYSTGFRLGFVTWHREKKVAHDLLSYFDFTVGKYRLYDFVGPNYSSSGVPGAGDNIRHYGLRKVFEGRLKVPYANVQLGFDANLGQGQNDLRFTVTTNAKDLFTTLFPSGSK